MHISVQRVDGSSASSDQSRNWLQDNWSETTVLGKSFRSSGHSVSNTPFSDSVVPDPHSPQIYCVVVSRAPDLAAQVAELGSTSRSVERLRAQETLASVYQLERGMQGRMAARTLMIFLEMSFKKRNLSSASALIESADLNKLGVHSLVGLVRTTSRAKGTLPSWLSLYKRSRSAVELKGYSADRLFVGISSSGSVGSDEKSS